MYFDRDTTVVVTKLNNLSDVSIKNYCQNFGPIVRCLIKTSSHSRNKDPCSFFFINIQIDLIVEISFRRSGEIH